MTEAALPEAPIAAVLIHGGTIARRSLLASAIREAGRDERQLGAVRVRVSSRAAEAAKCLADPAVVAVLLLDAPADAESVRRAAIQGALARHTYEIEPRDDADVVVRLVRTALDAHRRRSY